MESSGKIRKFWKVPESLRNFRKFSEICENFPEVSESSKKHQKKAADLGFRVRKVVTGQREGKRKEKEKYIEYSMY